MISASAKVWGRCISNGSMLPRSSKQFASVGLYSKTDGLSLIPLIDTTGVFCWLVTTILSANIVVYCLMLFYVTHTHNLYADSHTQSICIL